MENKVNAVIDAATQTKVDAALQSIASDLPFLIELSAAESKRLMRMEAGRADFVRRALYLAQSNPKIQPQFFEMSNYEKDISLTQSLDEIIGKVGVLLKSLNDTRDQAGNEAYLAALEVYSTAKRGAAKGVEGAQTTYDELKGMFEKQRNNTKTAETVAQ
jgi:hypothetical protein